MADTEKTKKMDILLALAMTEGSRVIQQTEDSCPDEEILACYFDGKLDQQERSQLFKRLLECPESYAQWLRMAETLGYPMEHQDAINPLKKNSWLEQITTCLSSYQKVWLGAVTASVLFFVVVSLNDSFISAPSLQERIAENWQKNQELYLAQVDVSEFVTRRLTKSTLEVVPFPEKIAFANGFRQGLQWIYHQQQAEQVSLKPPANDVMAKLIEGLPKQNMPCDNQRCETETPLNQQVGTWSALFLHQCKQRSEALSEPPTNQQYWVQQKQIYQHIKRDFLAIDTRFGKTEPSMSSINQRITIMAPDFALLPTNIVNACESINQMALYALQK